MGRLRRLRHLARCLKGSPGERVDAAHDGSFEDRSWDLRASLWRACG